MNELQFETWLGSIIAPNEKFYLIAESKNELQSLIERIAKIGYEGQVEKAFVAKDIKGPADEKINVEKFRNTKKDYTIVDIRNLSEVKDEKIFENSIHIPLPELRERVNEIPTDKPIVVHCAGGYRSAAGISIIKGNIKTSVPVFDLSEAVTTF
jgi:hydroxyacylglutathione hydrolase